MSPAILATCSYTGHYHHDDGDRRNHHHHLDHYYLSIYIGVSLHSLCLIRGLFQTTLKVGLVVLVGV